jgi:ATP-binding cassette subfamily B protein
MLTNFLNETQGFTNTLKVLGVHVDSIDVELRSRIEQSLEIQEFQLGFGFLVDQYLYIIGQGRVRLVSFSPEKQRDVSILTLGAEQSFGLEQLFYQADTDFLPYRAIAASSGLVTRIAIANIQEWLPQIPNLDAQIRQQVEEKQSLISAKILPQALPDIKFSPISPSSQWAEIKGAINLSQTKQANLHLIQKISQKSSQNQVLPVPNSANSQQNTESAIIPFPQPDRQKLRNNLPWANYPFVEQQSSSDCGAACLAMVSRYWGKQFSLNSLRIKAGVGRSGASLKGLARAAEGLGFQATPVRASWERLSDRVHPWIAHWQGNHYVVVYQVKGDRIVIADPAEGKRSLTPAEFTEGWTGYALLLEPTPELAKTPDQKSSLSRFVGLLLPHRNTIIKVLFGSLLLQLFSLVTPLFTQIILDRVVVSKSLTSLNVFAFGLLLFGIWRIGLGSARQYLLDYLSNRLDLTFLSGFINHTLRLPLSFFESRQVGDIITRVQETQKIQSFLTRQAVSTWLDVIMAFVYVGLMSYYNLHLTLLVLAIIPPIVILTVLASPLLRRVSRQIFKESSAQTSLLVEMMSGIATVKAAASEQEVRWRWEDRLTRTLNMAFKGQKLGIGLGAISNTINTIGSTALLWYGATLVIQDQLTIGQFVAFNMLIGNVISPILAVVGLWDEFQEILVSVERLDDVFTAQPEESYQDQMLMLPTIAGDVKFENVCFRYGEDDEKYTLQNISFHAQKGQAIAIVGRSGSGKSTLVKLLQGLYHPKSGRICIDDHDVRQISPNSLRSQLGVVPQECFLFSGTILENITLYRSDFSLEQVVEVAKLAEAHAFIQSFPLGYNTQVGERGSTLSGGQRQRIAIARALLAKPRILILDEATSSLDTDSERRFQQNLDRISSDRTTFIIAHRLSTVHNVDCILVLDQGILTEVGNHDQLMERKGIYYHLVGQQLDL